MSGWDLQPGQVIVPPPAKKKRIWPWLAAIVVLLAIVVSCGIVAAVDTGRDDPTPVITLPQESTLPSQAVHKQTSIGEGQWLIGTDAAPGTYRTLGAKEDNPPACIWTVKASEAQDATILDIGSSDGVNVPGRVVLKKGNVFETSGCKSWTKQ